LAKETIQAISDAEVKAREAILYAKEESEKLIAEATAQGEAAIKAAVKEAGKKADVLCGVARADAEKLKVKAREQTLSQQEALRKRAADNRGKVVEELRKIVLGKT